MITESEMRAKLREACDAVGGVHAWARKNSINQSYVQLAVSGKRGIGPAIAAAFGYEKKSVFTTCNQENESA